MPGTRKNPPASRAVEPTSEVRQPTVDFQEVQARAIGYLNRAYEVFGRQPYDNSSADDPPRPSWRHRPWRHS